MIHAYAAKTQGGKLEPFEYEPGKLSAQEVEINVEYCGICHSDLAMINNEWGFSQYPAVPGHEIVATGCGFSILGEFVLKPLFV
jgi:uncharacterized zinc-type alcohol dehydrogenase-like protein